MLWTSSKVVSSLRESSAGADAVMLYPEMLPALDNFISYGSDAIKARPDYKMMILDIYATAMKSDMLGENDRVNACKLIESYMQNLRGEVDDVSDRMLSTAIGY